MITVKVPATSANCCVGFDCLGMALNWKAVFHFQTSDKIIVEGCPKEFCNEDNLVLQAFYHTADCFDMPHIPVKVIIDSDIPFERGLGSSSTCIVGGILGANAFFDLKLSKEEVLKIATRIEGHPDNVAPAIYGSLTCSFMYDDSVHTFKADLENWQALAIIPDYPISTHEARKILPYEIPCKEAVSQVSHALAFFEAMQYGEEKIVFDACHDYLHEPYRKKLIRHYDTLKRIAGELQIPFWISGSGSTMLAVSLDHDKLKEFKRKACEYYDDLLMKELEVDNEGAVVINE